MSRANRPVQPVYPAAARCSGGDPSKAPEEALDEVVHALKEPDQPVRPAPLKGQVNASAAKRTLSPPAVHEHNLLAPDRAPEPAPDA
jgi:hypothetical protein